MSAGPDEDLVVAEPLLKAIEICVASREAASDRAKSALKAIMSEQSESPAINPYSGVNECRERLSGKTQEEFRDRCHLAREQGKTSDLFQTGEQLAAAGCFTRAAICVGFLAGPCQEPIPESELEIPDTELVTCLTRTPDHEILNERLYELFVDDEIEQRLEELKPAERETVRTLIQPTDVGPQLSRQTRYFLLRS